MYAPTIEAKRGNTPILLVVPHDGLETQFNGQPLDFNPASKKRDANTADIANKIYDYMGPSAYPAVISQKIKRQYLTPDITSHFANVVLREPWN